ncbi:MutS-related protein, partial [Natronomonas sp.]
AGGRSTFMVEMTELATILEAADENSLVVLDEVGRGTSTTDGYAIAQAATEHLHDEVGAYTLFATHHHELTDVAAELPRARNYHFSAERRPDGVDFEHDLREGPAEASYGVEVANTAGVPADVVQRAEAILADEADGRTTLTADDATPTSEIPASTDGGEASAVSRSSSDASTSDGGELPADILAELQSVDLAETTPLEALNLLSRLKSRVE